MSFIDSLSELGGDLTKDLGGYADKFLEYKIAKENAKGTRNIAETVQPNLAQPTAANPVTGVDSNGDTLVVGSNVSVNSLMQNKAVVYGGGGLLLVIASVVVYKAIG